MDARLCHGVTWSDAGPALTSTAIGPERGSPAGRRSLALTAGAHLGFEIVADRRYCLGFQQVHGRDDRSHIPCPDQAPADRGYQCARCYSSDDLRFMHDVHRSGIAPAGLKRYLDQPHLLYIATFADGSTKVGTSVEHRIRTRLVEQGAVVARIVARAADGVIIRLLEDEITRGVGLQQAVRSATKAAALCSSLPWQRLDHLNSGSALAAAGLLEGGLGIEGYIPVREEFDPPASWSAVLEQRGLQPYPEPLTRGRHGFTVREVLGPSALVALAGSEVTFVVDLTQLKGRRLVLGDFTTAVPTVQEALF